MSTVTGQSELLERYPYSGADPDWPVTAADFKLHAQITHSAEDALIETGTGGYLAAAVEEVELRGQVSLISQKRRLLLDEMPYDETIYLPRAPVQSITVVKYLDSNGDEQTLASTNYRFVSKGSKNQIYFEDSTDTLVVADGPGVVWIDYVSGYGGAASDVPAMWRGIVAALAYHMYERRSLTAGGGIDEAFERVITRKTIAAGAPRRYV